MPPGNTQNYVYVIYFLNISADRTENFYQELYVQSAEDAEVRVLIPQAGIDQFVTLDASNTPDRTYETLVTTDLGVAAGDRTTQNAGLIVSKDNKNIWATVNKMEPGTTAAYLALPVTQNSKEFFIPSYTVNRIFHTGFAFASLFDGTCMECYRVTGNSYQRMGLFHLDSLQVYTALSNDEMTVGDYTGVFCNSTKPMVAYGGHECAQIPLGIRFCDAIVEQIPPVVEWDKEFIVPPIAGRTLNAAGYRVRVISGFNNTTVTFNPSDDAANVTLLHRGEFQEYVAGTTDTTVVHIMCDQPCMVVQYNVGKETAGAGDAESVETDPFMMIIPPITKYPDELR